jgi:hypothetical protein
MAKTKFMIVSGASVVVIRDGKRKPIAPGSGTDFTEDEINTIMRATPGALRTPVNEGVGREVDEEDDDAEGGALRTTTTTTDTPTKKPKGKAKAKAAAEKPATPPPASDDADGDDDEDEDI